MAVNDASVKLARRLTALDSTFLYGKSANNNPLHIGSLLIFEGNIPFDDLVRHVDRRLHLLPRYRQRLAEVPFNLEHPTLEEDPDFRLENHVKRVQLPPNMTEAEAVINRPDLIAYEQELDRQMKRIESNIETSIVESAETSAKPRRVKRDLKNSAD